MASRKTVEEIKKDPSRIYRERPQNILGDRRFNDTERLEILQAWKESILRKDPDNNSEILRSITILISSLSVKVTNN